MIKVIMGINLILIFTAFANAHEKHFTKNTHSPQKSYEFRVSTMTIYKWYLSPMGAMVRGKVKYDAAAFADYAKGLADASQLALLAGFPKKSSENDIDDSSAKPIIWNNLEDFEKKFEAFQIASKKLATIAKKGDEKATKVQFKATADTCSSCHKKFKSK